MAIDEKESWTEAFKNRHKTQEEIKVVISRIKNLDITIAEAFEASRRMKFRSYNGKINALCKELYEIRQRVRRMKITLSVKKKPTE